MQLRSQRRSARVGKCLGAAAAPQALEEMAPVDTRVSILEQAVRQLVLAFGRVAEPAPAPCVTHASTTRSRSTASRSPPRCGSPAGLSSMKPT